jgi:hypothetical protein
VNILYSHILLIAFMIGALQPVTPMVQHLMFEGSLIEVLMDHEGDMCDVDACDMDKKTCTCEHHNAEDDQLLDIDYYPVPLQMGEQPVTDGINQEAGLCCPGDEQILSLHYQTDLPPPRLN